MAEPGCSNPYHPPQDVIDAQERARERMARMMDLFELMPKAFMVCEALPTGEGRVSISFSDLKDAQNLHKALVIAAS